MSHSLNLSALNNALDVFNECIKTGKEIENLCEKCTNATIKSHPIFKKVMQKIQEDTKEIERLKGKVQNIKKCLEENDCKKWKADVGDIINTFDCSSKDTMANLSHDLASSIAENVKRKFEENEKFFVDTDVSKIEDENVRNFFKVLTERNQKIIDCLRYANSQLPNLFKSKGRKHRKLFITSESVNAKSNEGYERLGELTIGNQSSLNTASSCSQVTELKQNLNGYLIEDSGKTEVLLKLKETTQGFTNLIEFSQNTNNFDVQMLTAKIEINGEVDDNVEVFEISYPHDNRDMKGSTAVAIVQDNKTGDLNHVPIQIVPTIQNNEVHGKIVGIQAANEKLNEFEDLESIHMDLSGSIFNSTFKDKSSKDIPHYATPSRKDGSKNESLRLKYYTPQKEKRDGSIKDSSLFKKSHKTPMNVTNAENKSAVLDQIVNTTTDKIMNSIMNDFSIFGDVSGIEYASFFTENDPSVYSENKVDSFRTPPKTIKGQKSVRNRVIKDDILNDISEEEFADLSSLLNLNQSQRSRNDSMFKHNYSNLNNSQLQNSMNNSTRNSQRINAMRNTSMQEPAEAVLVDLESSPLQYRQKKNESVMRGGNLIEFDGATKLAEDYSKNKQLKEMMEMLKDVLNDDPSSRLKRRSKVHDRSLPYSRGKSVNSKMLNRSLPQKIPKNVIFQRPVKVVPSRTPEDMPFTVEQGPLKPHEARRINQALEEIKNPFNNYFLNDSTPISSHSYHEQYNNNFESRNISLPSHLAPRKEELPPMNQSLGMVWSEAQKQNELLIAGMDDEDLQDISDPYPNLTNFTTNSSDENLENISDPFSSSIDDLIRSMHVQPANEYLLNFDGNENLDDVRFELIDD